MITFNNIVERFKVFAENHFFVKSFSFGSPDDVDLSKFTNFPLMHLVYTGANYDAGTKTYNLEVYILDVPSDKTKKVDRQKEVVSDAEQCAEDIIADIKNGGNIFLFAQDYEVVNANTTPLEEETKNVLSGVLLDLSVAIPYEWDACNAPINGVEPGGTEVTYARRGILRMLTLDGATDVASVRTIKVPNGTLTDNGDGVVTLDTAAAETLDSLDDVSLGQLSAREALIYDGDNWVNDNVTKADVGLSNVDNTSDADKPVSTATQTALDAKADTSSVPTELNDLSDVTISGTPTGNQALIYDAASSVFRSADNFTNRFEDDVERGSGNITPFVERAYGVKSDGDGIFIDNQSDTPSAGKVIVRKIYHKAGLITDTDVIGDYTLIHTFDDDTAYSATESTFEGFRDGDTYGTPPFTLIQTWEEQTAAPAFTGLLNETYGSGAAAAYSVRRLNGNYTGAAIQVERSSDNTTQDIGFDSNGDLDESALTTFCTGTVCKVRTWYDQSQAGGTGSGNDAVQTVHANQPTIYTGGAIVKENGRVMIDFDGQSMWGGNLSYDIETLFIVTKPQATASRWLFDFDDGGTAQIREDGAFGFTDYLDGNNYSGDYGVIDNLPRVLLRGENWSAPTQQMLKISSRDTGEAVSNPGQQELQEIIIYDSVKNSSDVNSIESNIGDYFTQNTPLLDTYTGAAAAYSLRKLRTAYTGSAIRVRRASDNAESDIGFNVFNELDTVSLAAFCGSSDGFVKTWYCQSGNANDATQTTAANQPKIYDSVTGVVTENGKPTADFDGTNHFLNLSIASLNINNLSVHTVCRSDDTSGNRMQFTLGTDTNVRYWHYQSSSKDRAYYGAASPFIEYGNIDTNQHLYSFIAGSTSTVFRMFRDGTEAGSTVTLQSGTPLTTQQRLGAYHTNSLNWSGTIQEFVVYSADSTNDRTGIESNINTFYSIY